MKKKKLWIAIGVVALILIMVGVSVFRNALEKAPEVKVAEAKIEEVSSTLMIPGTLKLQNEQVVYPSPELGEIKEILVKEGDAVKKGQLLAKRENPQLTMQVEQNRLAIESNQLRLKQIDKQWDQLDSELEQLAEQIGADAAEKQLAPQYEQLRMESDLTNLELDQALLQKDLLNQQVKELEIVSSYDGTVITVNQASGEGVSMIQDPVLVIGSLDKMAATGYLSEYDALKVSKDQKVALQSDAAPDVKWEGVVAKVGMLPENSGLNAEGQSVQYPIEVSITSGDVNLKPGFQLIMEIETEKKEALIIPIDSIKYENNKTYVYKVDGKIARKTEVELGISSGETIEVVKGLKAGDKVIKNPSAKITDGVEVTVK